MWKENSALFDAALSLPLGVLIIEWLIVYFAVFETRGLTLDQIQEEFDRRQREKNISNLRRVRSAQLLHRAKGGLDSIDHKRQPESQPAPPSMGKLKTSASLTSLGTIEEMKPSSPDPEKQALLQKHV